MNQEQTPQDPASDERDDAYSDLGYGRPAESKPSAPKPVAKIRKVSAKTSRGRRSTRSYIPFGQRGSDHVVTDEERQESQTHIDAAHQQLRELATRSVEEQQPARPPINEGDEVSSALDPPLPVNVVLAYDRGNGADPRTASFDHTVNIPPKSK